MSTTTTAIDQLSDILRLMLAAQTSDDGETDATARGAQALRQGRGVGPVYFEPTLRHPDRVGTVKVWCDHCDFVVELGGAPISLRARMKGNGLYPVCMIYPQAEGKARHGQIEQLARLLVPWLAQHPEWRDALHTALQRSGGHWEGVLVSWLVAVRLTERGALL